MSDKNDYNKGYVDGRKSAQRDQSNNSIGASLVNSISDAISGNPHYNSNGSSLYKEGWKEGHKNNSK